MEKAPASSPATPASRMTALSALAPATPKIRLALETRPSLTPNTAARRLPPSAARWRFSRKSALVGVPWDAGP
jgi:hypothetical protein